MRNFIIAAASLTLFAALPSAQAADAAAGKAKAAVCAGCHGQNGISLVPTYPNLAGQKEAYLVQAITDYKSGVRNGPQAATMKPMVAALSAEDIANLAAYFSSLK